MNYTLISVIGCVVLFLGMLLVAYLAYRLGRWRSVETGVATEGSGALTGAIFALLGLMLAFTFNGAFSRLDARRQLIVQESNAIGTAYLRLDLLPPEVQPGLRESFREYLASRVAFNKVIKDIPAATEEITRTMALQDEIWNQAVVGSREAEYQAARLLLLPALNEMIDIVTTRSIAIQTHPPVIIWVVLSVLALTCAGIAGYSASAVEHPRYIYMIAFAAITVLTIYVILDVEYPSSGFVRLVRENQMLANLAEMMK
ncbi:MAG: DUF4239 domain-containing protein [Anaerolineales bacterium]|nr:MAG: DUF4239 domain-containing protein [Anaerolineales bacterium]